MTLLVVDASILVAALYPVDPRSRAAAVRLTAASALFVCAHTDAEVLQTLRNLARKDQGMTDTRVRELIDDLYALALRRVPPDPGQARRAWELRHNVSFYDALYVAAAEALGASLVTGDGRLAAAPGPRCPIELIT